MNDNSKVYMIKSDGALWYGLKELAQLDWHEVVNPKRSYYPEYDKTHPAYQEKHINQLSPDDNFIEVEKL